MALSELPYICAMIKTMNGKAEAIRVRYLYRDMILRGKMKLSVEAARKIVGPDCAYHLYSRIQCNPSKIRKKQGRMGKGMPYFFSR
jgi:hypothetical protein